MQCQHQLSPNSHHKQCPIDCWSKLPLCPPSRCYPQPDEGSHMCSCCQPQELSETKKKNMIIARTATKSQCFNSASIHKYSQVSENSNLMAYQGIPLQNDPYCDTMNQCYRGRSWVSYSQFQCSIYNQTRLAHLQCHKRSWSVGLHLVNYKYL